VRVGLLTREYPPEVYGGAGVHIEYLSEHLASLVNVEVHAFGGQRPSSLVKANYEPWSALASERPEAAVLQTLSVDLAMASELGGVDVVHSHTWYANMGGHLASLLYDIPHICTAHSLEPLRPWKAEQLGGGYRVSSWCEKTAQEAAAAVIAVSGGMRNDILRAYPAIDPERVKVIHNGIDTDEYQPQVGVEHLVRFGVDPDVPYILFVGRITHQKGVTYLLDALSKLEHNAQVVLLAGQPDTAELGALIKSKVAGLAVQRPGVFWIEEMLPRAGVVQFMAHASVFVCPSIYEPFGLINVEAMAAETAVVASAVGGIPEIVVPGETGTLVPFEAGHDLYGSPADPARFSSDIAQAIDELLANPALAQAMGKAGRQRAIEHFSWEEIARQTVALYQSVLR